MSGKRVRPDAIRVDDYYAAAEWVRAHGGSCTSPMAVEMGMEDAWRVKAPDGAPVVAFGDYLVHEDGAILAMTADQYDRWWAPR